MPLALQNYSDIKTWEFYKAEIEHLQKSSRFHSDDDAIAFARTFCGSVIKHIWLSVDYRKRWKCRQIPCSTMEMSLQAIRLSMELAKCFLSLNLMEYSYLLGATYTMLLPDSFRANNGIYYTPPVLAERLLDLLAAEGADWAKADILDPACGGGAFLVTVANRILGDYRIKELSSGEKLEHIEKHLVGIEIDAFAGWLTQTLLDIMLYSEAVRAGRRLKAVVKIRDTVQYALSDKRQFDIIVGNPPYGRVKLDEPTRKAYSRSLFGHANLYGVFIDAALRLKTSKGLIGFVTPTSFMGGKYFSNLRNTLYQLAPPLAVDFVSMRNGVFDQVLQETCLVTFGNNSKKTVVVNKIHAENDACDVERIGSFKITGGTSPWIIAREPSEANIAGRIMRIKTTLKDYGYKASTGQLVWNRMKEHISESYAEGRKPIIWAEAITADGTFSFNYRYRKKLKYISISDKQGFLRCKTPVVLVQRTTAKEQNRRLQACVLPQKFIDEWDGAVIENHVNMLYPITDKPKVSLEVLALILNSQAVDRVFRCLSGSVAVSATELHALPLPPAEKLSGIETLLTNSGSNISDAVEQIIEEAYGLGSEIGGASLD